MTKQTTAAASRPHAPFMRAMALLLLLLVAYGATVEVVHKHGNSGKGYAAATSSTKVVDKEGSAATDARTSGACLICQLHQNLFTSLFNAQPKLVAPPALVARTTVQPTSYLSQMDAPRRGRAPPFTSPL